jgi:lipopolysaccharide transport system permease protein
MESQTPRVLHQSTAESGWATLSPKSMLTSVYTNRQLILRMARRELEGRFKGSRLGILWVILQPLLMLAVYTFAFGVVLQARWGQDSSGSPWEYALFLFTGLLVFNVFAEVVGRAPALMLENTSYIKNMVFPTEILPVVALLVALFNFAVGFVVLIVLYLVQRGLPPLTSLFIVLPLLPLGLFTLGLAWFFSALGVYVRDLRQLVAILIPALMFLSPLFYPVSILPETVRPFIMLNPLAPIIESMRDLVFFGRMPEWRSYLIGVAGSAFIAWLGFIWFVKTRRGFADVV